VEVHDIVRLRLGVRELRSVQNERYEHCHKRPEHETLDLSLVKTPHEFNKYSDLFLLKDLVITSVCERLNEVSSIVVHENPVKIKHFGVNLKLVGAFDILIFFQLKFFVVREEFMIRNMILLE
jgi:hypothetical protein